MLEHRISRRQVLKITAVVGVSLAAAGGLISALLQMAGLHHIRKTRAQMGTLVTISVVHPDAAMALRMVDDVFIEIERLEGILSRHREGTPIARLNREGVVLEAPTEAVQVVRRAMAYSSLTHGAFDITVNPLLNLYTSSFAQTGMPPSESRVNQALSLVGYQNVLVDDDRIAFKKTGMSITLDGIAKGYIVDRAVDILRDTGAERVLVDAGGDMGSASGGPQGDSWKIAIQDPWDASGSLGAVHLQDQSVATSGDYLNYFTSDRRLHHIIDPRTGRSPVHTSAVTIVAPKAVDADALSTGILVMGPQDGLRLIEQLENVEGVIVTKGQDVLRSRGLASP